MPYDEGGPDPMSLELMDLGGKWYLFITNPILLGQQNEPTNDWQTELSDLVDDELVLVDSALATGLGNPVYSIRSFSMPTGPTESGRILVSQFRDANGTADFGVPTAMDTVDYVQRKATARLEIAWNNGVVPSNYDGCYLPVAGFKRAGTFAEKDRFPVQVVSYGNVT